MNDTPKLRLATVWLGGCSGCHMSLLDLDEWLIDLASYVDLVYSPIADTKIFPEGVDLALVEGAIACDEHMEIIHRVRANSTILVSLGDCAVTGNVTALRNPLGEAGLTLQQIYVDHGDPRGIIPAEPGIVPVLLDKVVPVHAVVHVDRFLPGCPPPAPRIRAMLEALLAGREPDAEGSDMLRFG
ncbi:oxidoreductase [Oscillochloris sp. ZM17-4]|uniref:NADH-quinone oxidoreductase subunit B family protein n=1 Tax=Oscillochloris sp. ZM17-4 TaxID=2866714 RepID=UPI002103436E|nr:oxidoreductase [Oscillochloris sp. ZM17-4]